MCMGDEFIWFDPFTDCNDDAIIDSRAPGRRSARRSRSVAPAPPERVNRSGFLGVAMGNFGNGFGALARLAITACALGAAGLAQAQDKLVVLTTWFAQAEHGGLYQAAVTGIYKKHGLDVTVKSGGPQVNGIQLLLAGQADFIMNYDFAVLQGVERGLPLVTVAAPFQFDLQGVLAHEDVKSLAGLKDKTILVAGTG